MTIDEWQICPLTATVISDPDDKNFDLEAYLQHVAADLFRGQALLLDSRGDRSGYFRHLVDGFGDLGNSADCFARCRLHAGDLCFDLARRLGRLRGERLDFLRNDREALACIACARPNPCSISNGRRQIGSRRPSWMARSDAAVTRAPCWKPARARP